MADYTPACPTCGNKVKDITENMDLLDRFLKEDTGGSRYREYPWYTKIRDAETGGEVIHPQLGKIKVIHTSELEEDSYGEFIDGEGFLVFELDGEYIRKEFSYNSYGTLTWLADSPRKVQKKAKTVTVYEYE